MSPQLVALLLSLGVEVPILLALVRWRAWPCDWRRLLLLAPGVTLLTHPFAWALNEDLAQVAMLPRLAFIELAVVLIEGLILGHWARLGVARGFQLALLANAASFLAGLLVFR